MWYWIISGIVLLIIGFFVWLIQRQRRPHYQAIEPGEDPLELGYEGYRTQATLVRVQTRRKGCINYFIFVALAVVILAIARALPDYIEYRHSLTYTPTPTITMTPTLTPEITLPPPTPSVTPTPSMPPIPLGPLETSTELP